MRNGIYRVWINGPSGRSTGAVVFNNGDLMACNRSFAFTGRYTERGKRLTADVRCKRLIRCATPSHLPDIDEFHLRLEGESGSEIAVLTGTVPEVPGYSLTLEYAWLCEV